MGDVQTHSPLGIHLPRALFIRFQKARSYQRILDRNAAADPLGALRSTGQVQRRAGSSRFQDLEGRKRQDSCRIQVGEKYALEIKS